jgi:uncharacterized membrane protein
VRRPSPAQAGNTQQEFFMLLVSFFVVTVITIAFITIGFYHTLFTYLGFLSLCIQVALFYGIYDRLKKNRINNFDC